MSEEEKNIEKIANAIISYLTFKENVQKIKEDHQINIGKNEYDSSNCSYILREFNTDCYIIEKDHFKEFCYSVNFNNLTMNLDISDEKSKNNFIQELKSYLKKNPYVPNPSNIKIYSKLEEMKEIATDFKNYEFVNEDLLCHGMGVPRSNLKGKIFKVSKNKENTCLMSVDNDYTFIINNSDSDKENEEYKNLYYVDDLTKKIFILLFFNEQKIKKMLKKEIKDVYKFKKYYLISKKWLNEYKEFFVYDFVIKKYKEEYKKEYNYEDNNNEENDNDEIYSYDITNINLNDIVKNMGQINLYKSTEPSKNMRNAKKLIPGTLKIIIKDKVLNNQDLQQETVDPELIETYIKIYREFDLINKDIFDLLEKEEFFYGMNKDIKNQIEFQALIGNNNIIIKNKPLDKDNERYNYLNEYLFYVDKNDKMKYLEDKDIEKNEEFILYYILNYTNNKSFFNDLKSINKKNGLYEYIQHNNIIINALKIEENIKDKRGNFVGYFLNIRINEEGIKSENIYIKEKEKKNDNEVENFKKEKSINLKKNNDKNKENNNIIIKEINFSLININNSSKKQNKINDIDNKDNCMDQNNFNNNMNNIINNNKPDFNDKNNIINNNFVNSGNSNNRDSKYKLNLGNNNIINNNIINNDDNDGVINNDINNEENNKINEEGEIQKINNIEFKESLINDEEIDINEQLKIYNQIINNKNKKNIDGEKNNNNNSKVLKYVKDNLKKFKNHIKNIYIKTEGLLDIDEDIILNDKNLSTKANAKHIILMNEENFQRFQKLFERINKYYQLKEEEKKEFLKKNLNEIYDSFLFFDGISKKEILLIDGKSFEDKKNKEKFYILSRENDIIKKILLNYKDIEDIYYYERKKDLFILFCEQDKEYQIKKSNNYWELIKPSTKNKNIIEIFENNIKKYSIKENIEKFYLNQKIYTEFYLINEKWSNYLIKNKTKKNPNKINPETKVLGFNDFNTYNNFRLIDANKKEIMEQIKEKYCEDKSEDLIIKQIFFVYGNTNKNIKKTLYFGIIDNNMNEIYFYLFEKQNYSVDFIISYTNHNIFLSEIENKIVLKGIEIYLNEFGFDLFKPQEFQELINLDLEVIGKFLNKEIKNINNNTDYSKPLPKVEESFYYNGVIQSLVNIDQLKRLFLNRAKLLKKIRKNHKMSMNFYKLMQYMWIFKENKNNKEEILSINSYIFLSDILELSKNVDIFKDIKQLIEFILLSMHCEQKLNQNIQEKDEQNINYEIDNLKEMSTEIKNSFIKELFFFELELDNKCCDNNSIMDCYLLYFSSKELETIQNQSINIDSIIPLKKYFKCKNCKKEINSKYKFKSLPQILIIVFPTKINYTFNFLYKDKLNLKKYSKENNNINYELISLIIKDGKEFETYCKSSIEKEKDNWNHYKEGASKQIMTKITLKQKQNPLLNQPYLLIYKKCKK